MASPTMAMLKKQQGTDQAEATEAKPVAKKTPVKKKTSVKAKATDLIEQTVAELEILTQEDTLTAVPELIGEAEFSYFRIGGLLAKIHENDWWKPEEGAEGYGSFKDFVETEYDLYYRKAMYLIGTYNSLVESGVTWEAVQSVGWTKLKEIAPLLTQENVEEWVERASEMTTLQLIDYIRAMKAGDAKATEAGEQPAVSTMTFKVHADQKESIRKALNKVKEDIETEFDAVALEHIAMQYLEGTLGKKTVTKVKPLATQMKEAGVEKVLAAAKKTFGDDWPEEGGGGEGGDLSTIMEGMEPEDVLEKFSEVFPDVSVTVEM